jgi:ABC-type dipeptide/oligopeptide/nickel transport system permease component
MLSYVIRRLLQGVVTIFLVSIVTFSLMHISPGDPIEAFVGDRPLTSDQIELLRERWGLDLPLHEQYINWMSRMVRGDFGDSIMRPGQTVNQMIRDAAPATIYLNVFALVISVAIALPLGIAAGVRRYSGLDYTSMLFSVLGVCIPNFWLALMLILLFGVYIDILPTSGVREWSGWVLPVVVLATAETALLARLMRSSTVEVLTEDYVRTARSKGLKNITVIVRHAVRNALLPITSVIGYRIAFMLSGTIIVEQVFAISGLGRMFINAVNRSDYQVVQAMVLLFAIVIVLVNILTDIIYAFIDPRIRIS